MKRHLKEVIVLITFIIFIIIFSNNIIKQIKEEKQIEEEQAKYEEELEENKKYLSDIIEDAKDIDKSTTYTYNNPYILEGFTHISGEYNSGFVIQDNLGNEFVWIPCSLAEEKDIIILGRHDFNKDMTCFLDTKVYQCMEKDKNIEEFILSVQKYGGFYIARYEAGKENETLVSKPNVQVWNNISKVEALELATKMYNSNEFTCSLINSFAWDTTLKWLEKTNNIEYSEFAIDSVNENTYVTGQSSINNIYDMNGNVSEWTTEMLEEYAIFRAGKFFDEELNDTSAYVGVRNAIAENAKYDSIGFRVILFKQI